MEGKLKMKHWDQLKDQEASPKLHGVALSVMPQSYYHVLAATLYLRCWHPRFEDIGVDFGWVPRCVTMYYVVATI